MNYSKYLLGIAIIFLLSCGEEPMRDPCVGLQCPYSYLGNDCNNGECACETDNFSYFQWTWRYQGCATHQFINARLEVNGTKLGDYIVGQPTETTEIFKINASGQVPYKVTSTSNDVVVEEGNLQLIKCELTELNSVY